MALLDAKDLGVSSKAFNVFSHLLAELKGGFLLQGSWRKTYVWTKDFSSRSACTKKEDFSPVKVEDFYSDYLFQSWLCASVEIKDEWIFRDNIERRSHLSVDDFVRDFERPNKPVLITHAINDRPALERWNQEYLLELCGDELTSKVVPTIVKLFASTDRAIRASFSAFGDWFFGHLCPATRTNVEVNAHSCTKDHCNLHSESSCLKEDLLSKLQSDAFQVDEEPAIRTNTTILLGNIAGLLNDSTRKRVLINAFTVRAPRDGFAPAKGCCYYGPHSHKPILRCGRDCYSSLVALTIDADSDQLEDGEITFSPCRNIGLLGPSSRPTEPNIRHSFNRVLGTYRRHCCRCSIRGASPRPLSEDFFDSVRDGWDDMEDSAAATATPSLSRIQAAQQRPIASAPRPSHTNTNGPEQTTTGATVSRQASKTQVSDDEDPWAEIAAPPPSTKPRPVVSTQSRENTSEPKRSLHSPPLCQDMDATSTAPQGCKMRVLQREHSFRLRNCESPLGKGSLDTQPDPFRSKGMQRERCSGKSGASDAKRAFDTIDAKNVFSWSTMEAYSSLEEFSKRCPSMTLYQRLQWFRHLPRGATWFENMPERNVFSWTEVPCGKTFASFKDLVFPIAVNKGFRHLSKQASALNAHIESKIPSCQRSFSTCLEDHLPRILSSGSTVLHCACLHAGTTKVCCLFMHASGGLLQNFPMSEEIDNGATSKNKKRRVDAVNQAWKIFATDYEEEHVQGSGLQVPANLVIKLRCAGKSDKDEIATEDDRDCACHLAASSSPIFFP
ncbi:hypothetical protein SELMODRAFT_419936 [Selaginella moellendorffii]|uniref:Uncharacterized protein n=1 Tax=Selaginella moellendorffii TaxID=88036 RepID=D8SA20_SELML|nr:hypothetical protein SELMODRAFT_419936 [Selaginella moellendorffii]